MASNPNPTGIPERGGRVEADHNRELAEAEIRRLNVLSAQAAVADAQRQLAEAKAAQ